MLNKDVYSNCGPISYHLEHIARYRSRIATFVYPHLCLTSPWGMNPSEFHKDVVVLIGLTCAEENTTICQAVSIQYRSATDGRTDGQNINIAVLTRDKNSSVARFYSSPQKYCPFDSEIGLLTSSC